MKSFEFNFMHYQWMVSLFNEMQLMQKSPRTFHPECSPAQSFVSSSYTSADMWPRRDYVRPCVCPHR